MLLVFLALLLAACSPAQTAPPPDEVTLQLKWVHQAQFAGFYIAQENGYYTGENIQVTFIEGGPDIDLVGSVTGGQADFGVDAPEQLFEAAAQGAHIKAIAVILRLNPMVFISMAASSITRLEDFAGKTFAITGSDAEMQFQAMMARLGLDAGRVKLIPHSYDNADFYNGAADLTIGYATGSLIRIRQAGYQVETIWPEDYGIHLYADTLFTSDRLIAQNPDLVTRFLRASLRGWQDAVGDPQSAVRATLNFAREADPSTQTLMMQASVPLIHTGQDHIGWMDARVWQEMHDILLTYGALHSPLAPDQIYTTAFLEEIYGGGQ